MQSCLDYKKTETVEKITFHIQTDPMPSLIKPIGGNVVFTFVNGSLENIELPFNEKPITKEKLYLYTLIDVALKRIEEDDLPNEPEETKFDLFNNKKDEENK